MEAKSFETQEQSYEPKQYPLKKIAWQLVLADYKLTDNELVEWNKVAESCDLEAAYFSDLIDRNWRQAVALLKMLEESAVKSKLINKMTVRVQLRENWKGKLCLLRA
jgi:hypothetical protein